MATIPQLRTLANMYLAEKTGKGNDRFFPEGRFHYATLKALKASEWINVRKEEPTEYPRFTIEYYGISPLGREELERGLAQLLSVDTHPDPPYFPANYVGDIIECIENGEFPDIAGEYPAEFWRGRLEWCEGHVRAASAHVGRLLDAACLLEQIKQGGEDNIIHVDFTDAKGRKEE